MSTSNQAKEQRLSDLDCALQCVQLAQQKLSDHGGAEVGSLESANAIEGAASDLASAIYYVIKTVREIAAEVA